MSVICYSQLEDTLHGRLRKGEMDSCFVGTCAQRALAPSFGCKVEGPEFRAQGSGLRVQGSGFRVQGSGFRVQGSGFRVQGLGFGVRVLVNRVWG